jgi:hypothetical protein
MAAIGTSWAADTWDVDAWGLNTWADAVPGEDVDVPPLQLFRAVETAGVRRAAETAGVARAVESAGVRRG